MICLYTLNILESLIWVCECELCCLHCGRQAFLLLPRIVQYCNLSQGLASTVGLPMLPLVGRKATPKTGIVQALNQWLKAGVRP